MIIDKNYFELFSLPKSFDIDLSNLSANFRALQKVVHPDNFANGIEQERLQSIQQASLINSAYETLKSPISRANYMLCIEQVDVEGIKPQPEFLMRQIEIREHVDDAKNDIDELDVLSDQIAKLLSDKVEAISRLFLELPPNYEAVAIQVQEAQFYIKLQENVSAIILSAEHNE